ncbi:MAG TPA: DUF3592 domain-containing protein, partial [Terracidiphilus sp.]|nr:DUF3592 domain-containing protein [Terracidiphilus sp.]
MSLIVAAILLVAGCYQTYSSRQFQDAASREVSTAGVITYVSGGRSTTYEFKFQFKGRQTYAESGSCHTPLSYGGCAVGQPVLVYYDPGEMVATTLQEYGDHARDMLFLGVCLILAGIIVTVLHFVFARMEKDSDEDEDPDEP